MVTSKIGRAKLVSLVKFLIFIGLLPLAAVAAVVTDGLFLT
jgi:hypothetical protein